MINICIKNIWKNSIPIHDLKKKKKTHQTWNKEKFPQPDRNIQNNLQVTSHLHGKRFHSPTYPPRSETRKTKMSTLTTSTSTLRQDTMVNRHWKWSRKVKTVYIHRKHDLVGKKKSKKSRKSYLIISEFRKVTEYKVKKQKSTVFLCNSNK